MRIDKALLICIVSLLGANGISLLWYLDNYIYHPITYRIIKETLKLENKFSFLPKLHKNMQYLSNKKKDPLFYDSLFYATLVFFLLLAFDLNLGKLLLPRLPGYYTALIFASVLIIAITIEAFIIYVYVKKAGVKTMLRQKAE